MIALWKGKNPIYFGVITIIPFDNLYKRAYFVMHTFLDSRFLLSQPKTYSSASDKRSGSYTDDSNAVGMYS
jgi:hypothetical protein